jgi:sulfatase maturation enzyme AslB (radical SAM superfamily)
VVIGSNGTLIDTDVAKQLKTSGIMAVQISIDGAEAQTHDRFRGEVGAFDKALEGAKSFRGPHWTWDKIAIGKHTIKVIAYDDEGNSATDEREVRKFL